MAVPDPSAGEEQFRRRLVGLFALSLMEREGPVHGYWVSDRIAQRTEGSWRPGPGAVYPSLRKLAQSGLVRTRTEGRRQVYSITPAGRQLLERIRAGRDQLLRTKPDLGLLWAEVMGAEDLDEFLLLRLRRTLDALEAQMGQKASQDRRLRDQVVATLTAATARYSGAPSRSPATVRVLR